MKEKIEYKGYWWLPSNSDETVAGILTYIPNDRITLELIGTFDSKRASIVAFSNKKPENIIHGFTSDSKEITLSNCYAYGSISLSSPFPIIKYSCQYMIIGKHIEGFEQKSFHKAYVTIPELTHWCPPSVFKNVIRFSKDDKIEYTSISFRAKGKTLNSTQIDCNTHLNIKEGVNYEGDHFSPKLEQFTYLEILKQNDTSIEDFYANIYMFEQFLSLATLQTSKCSEILLYDKDVFQELQGGEKLYHPIQLKYVQRDINETPKSKKYDFLFDYNSIAQHYPQIIQKWYAEKENIAPIRTHLVNSIKDKSAFSSVDFLIIIQAIEGFWWRFRDDNYKLNNQIPAIRKTGLKIIIEELTKEFDSIHIINTLDIDIISVVDSRHYYSHFMNKSRKPNTLDGRELFDLTFKLRKLLICCLLHFIGFDYSQINKILNRSNSNLLY